MKRLTAFCFSFFCCNPKIVSIFAPAMAKCIFYILLGLFLISKFTSVSDDMEGCKTLPTADVHYFSGATACRGQMADNARKKGRTRIIIAWQMPVA